MRNIFNKQSGTTDDSAAQFQGIDEAPHQPSPTPAAVQPGMTKVVLSSEHKDKALGEGLTNIGMVGVTLPGFETQLRGFELPKEHAATLVGQYPQYKFLIDKGQATPPVFI